jgi:general secretion pathway protein D
MVNLRLAIWLLFTASSLPVYADHGTTEYKKGAQAERQGDYDAAYEHYRQAYVLEPKNPKFFAAYTRVRFSASSQHVHNGQILRDAGALKEALAEFQHAVQIDATSALGQQELRRTADMLRKQEQQRSAPKASTPDPSPLDDVGDLVKLHPLSKAAITLHLTANADVVYKTICKIAGLNVLIDPDYHPPKLNIDLTDVTLREALDMVRLQSKTYWRPVSPNTIFVTADSASKRKELEENVMKTFYLRNITSPSELQEAANVVRQILDVSKVQLLQAQDALILRGTADQMILAEKLLADYDKPKSEVVIDVAVMQVSRDRIHTLGTNPPTSISAALVPNASNGTTGSSSSGFTVKSLGTLTSGNFVVSIPGASFSILASDSNTKILQDPEIRALNDEKATLRIGDRVPIATGSFQPGIVGGGGVSPLVGTQFQYLDVGVNIDIVPHIHSTGEVTLKMSLEISSVTGSQSIGGITQPIIGQRRIEHTTRLRDGEVNLLGGILEDSETQSLSGYPWISRIPVLKYLFAQTNKDHRENEIVFAITPHIVRSREVTDENVRMIAIGTANSIELRRNQPRAPNSPAEPPAEAGKAPLAGQEPHKAAAPSAPGRAGERQASPQPQPAGSQ